MPSEPYPRVDGSLKLHLVKLVALDERCHLRPAHHSTRQQPVVKSYIANREVFRMSRLRPDIGIRKSSTPPRQRSPAHCEESYLLARQITHTL